MPNLASSTNQSLYIYFGKQLRRLRDRAGLTQAQLATSVKLSRTSIANIEMGRQQVLLHTVYGFASALRVSIAELLPEVDSTAEIGIPQEIPNKDREWIESLVAHKKAPRR